MDIRTAAMEVVLAWGPERGTPERERLQKSFPSASDMELEAALTEAHRVIAQAESMASGVKQGREHQPTLRLQRERPWLTDEQASRALQQGLYYHWRDTGE